MRRFILLSAGAAVILGTALSVGAATTEDVVAKFTKKLAEVKTLEADIKMISKDPDGKPSEMSAHLVSESIVKDGKVTGRKMNYRSKSGPGGGMLMVNDGEFMWTEMKNPRGGQVMVIKQKADAEKWNSAPVARFVEQYDLKLTGEQEFGGQKMWVMEGKPKEAAGDAEAGPGIPPKVRLFIGQKDNLCHRYFMSDEEGEEADFQLLNIKVNEKVDENLFRYTPPEGGRVMDRTEPRE